MLRAATRPAALAALLCLAGAASGDPRAPVDVVPVPDLGTPFQTGLRDVDELPKPMREREYFVSGEVDVYRYGTPPVRGEIFLRDDVETAYTTRIVVRTPERLGRFSGTVVVEWFNSTAGFDSAPAWDTSAEYFSRTGTAYVGVTVSPVAVAFLVGGCTGGLGGAATPCGDRYQGMSMPEPGQAYEMVSQIATLLRKRTPDNPLYPRFVARRVFHTGQSQQAADVTTYAREFHFENNDGYVLQAGLGPGKPLSSGSPAIPPTAPDGLAPEDLPVPVVRIQTESDVVTLGVGTRRQPAENGPNFRYYEVAGSAHVPVHEGVEIFPAGVFGPEPFLLEDFCRFEMNTGADGPVFESYVVNAVWRNMERQLRRGVPPPVAEPMELVGNVVQRDEFGNARGGIRLPAMNVPLAKYGARNAGKPSCSAPGAPAPPDCLPPGLAGLGNLFCLLAGTTEPFDEATLDELYPSRLGYRLQVLFDSVRLRREGFLLPADQAELLRRAWQVDVGREPRWPRWHRRRW